MGHTAQLFHNTRRFDDRLTTTETLRRCRELQNSPAENRTYIIYIIIRRT